MTKLSVYHTVSFWFCIAMAWINLVLILIAMRLHNAPLMILAALTLAVSMVGALAHWYLDGRLRKP